MASFDERIGRALAAQDGEAPAFDSTMEAAARRLRARRQRRQAGVGLAAAFALTAVLLSWQMPSSPGLVAESELLGSTQWTAPSDVLLPARRTNVYEDLPVLIESTKPDEGALL